MRLIITSLLLLFSTPAFSQIFRSLLADINTKEQISDAFIFISNSSISTVSDSEGQFSIDRTHLPTSDIVITHINYETKYLLPKEVFKVVDTIFLSPAKYEIEEVVLKSKGSRKRKKWLRRFTKSLLGNTKNATGTKLMNPEVVLFQEKERKLNAYTSDYLIFNNETLGYKIWFFLSDYSLEKDDDVMYSGKVYFEDHNNLKPQQLANRNAVFERSSRKFFIDYTSENYDSTQYGVAIATLENDGFFHYVGDMKRTHLLKNSEKKERSELRFSQFLRIENRGVFGNQEKFKNSLGFGNVGIANITKKSKNKGDRSDYAVSYISSRSNKLVINENGIIQNPKDIEEYGYWSELRLADRLPDDFEYVPLEQY